MTIASVALSGIYPLAGFFSKDKILEVAFNNGSYYLWFALFIGAGMTAFYSFRLIMIVFFGEKVHKKLGFHPHETYPFVIYALTPLALLSIVAGFLEHSFEEFTTQLLRTYEFNIDHSVGFMLIIATSTIAIGGIAFAVFKYKRGGFSDNVEKMWIYKLLTNQYYIPQFYDVAVLKPFAKLSNFFWQSIDLKIIDASVDGIAKLIYNTGEQTSKMQSGNLSSMLRWMVVGVVVALALAVLYVINSAGVK